MSNGSLDYTKLTDRQILLLLVQNKDEEDKLKIPQRVASLERWRSWFAGVGAAISAGVAFLEARRHG